MTKETMPRPEAHQILVGVIDNDAGEPLFYAEVALTPSDLRKFINVMSHQLGFKGAMINDFANYKKVMSRTTWELESDK